MILQAVACDPRGRWFALSWVASWITSCIIIGVIVVAIDNIVVDRQRVAGINLVRGRRHASVSLNLCL